MEARSRAAPLTGAALAARRLGILGGSFDPPHLGHLHAARCARDAFQLEHVLFVPAARPPHKPERILASGAARLTMLAHLLAGEEDFSVWDFELAGEGLSWTIDTLRALRARVHGAARLFLIIGEDNLAGLPGWRAAEEILTLAQPIVVHRGETAEVRARTASLSIAGLSSAARTRLELGLLDSAAFEVSSSELRAELERGEVSSARFPPALGEYLRAAGLYRRS